MNRYVVPVKETVLRFYTVEAANETEAEAQALRLFRTEGASDTPAIVDSTTYSYQYKVEKAILAVALEKEAESHA